jgi:hypothetical protein
MNITFVIISRSVYTLVTRDATSADAHRARGVL